MRAIFPSNPRRWLLVRGNGTYQAYMEPFASNSGFVLYGKGAEVDAVYSLGKKGAFDGYDLGFAARPWRHLSLGASLSKVTYSQRATVTGAIPHPTQSFVRQLEGSISNLHREERAFHVEIGATVGDARFEATAFIGPSRLSVSQDVITRLTVREDSLGAEIAGATGLEHKGESRIGINLGVDVAFFAKGYFGLGLNLRYVRTDVSFISPSVVTELIAGGAQVSFGARFRY